MCCTTVHALSARIDTRAANSCRQSHTLSTLPNNEDLHVVISPLGLHLGEATESRSNITSVACILIGHSLLDADFCSWVVLRLSCGWVHIDICLRGSSCFRWLDLAAKLHRYMISHLGSCLSPCMHSTEAARCQSRLMHINVRLFAHVQLS